MPLTLSVRAGLRTLSRAHYVKDETVRIHDEETADSHTFDIDASREGTTANAEDRVLFTIALIIVPEYDVRIEIWNKTTNAVDETIGTGLDATTYGNDVQCLVSGVAQKTLTTNQVVRIRLVHSSSFGTVSIDYDGAGTTGDSRTTLPIPELPILIIPLTTTLLVTIVAMRSASRRRERHPDRNRSRSLRLRTSAAQIDSAFDVPGSERKQGGLTSSTVADSVPGTGGR